MTTYRIVRIGQSGRRFSVSAFDDNGTEIWLDVGFSTEDAAHDWIERRKRWDRGEMETSRTTRQTVSSD